MAKDWDAIGVAAARVYAQCQDVEVLLKVLRDSGVNRGRSVLLLARILDVPLRKADEITLCSQTWADEFEEALTMREPILRALEIMREEERNADP
jgi:hypothetical protein